MKRGKIWQIPEAEFRDIVAQAASVTEVLRLLGVSLGSSSRETVKKRIAHLQLETAHLEDWKDREPNNKIPLEDILVEHSNYPRSHLKNRLLEHHLLEYRCAICGIGPEWEGKELVLALDHINGVKDDHRLENLRFVCPNCHSQTETFSGKNVNRSF